MLELPRRLWLVDLVDLPDLPELLDLVDARLEVRYVDDDDIHRHRARVGDGR
ncbi:MAG TPA: hypothetical protein VK116_13350 [Planctomycetota bacterium]|nr:hypothetical protein [Planctomycetota bacterium]